MFQFFKNAVVRGKQNLKIGLVAVSPATKASIGELTASQGGVAVQEIDGANLLAKSPVPDVNVLVYDLDISSEIAVAEFDRFMKVRPATIPVIVLSPAVDDEFVRWFLRLRVSDWVKTPFAAGELIAACGRVLGQAKSSKGDIKCLTFIGAKGGVGTTTIAIHAALALLASGKNQSKTCLVDMDFLNASCADYLDLPPHWAIDDLIGDPERLDTHMFGTMLTQHGSGLSVLAAQRSFFASDEFSEDVITRPLDIASQSFSNIVIDLPRTATRWTENMVYGATSTYIVTEFTVPGLKAARRMANQLSEQFGSETSLKVIVNRYARDFFGSNLAATEAKELLGPYLAGFVPDATKLVSEAINRGIPTTGIKSRNVVFKAVEKIVRNLA